MELKIAGKRLSRLLHGEDILRKLISTFECFQRAAEFPSSQSSSREFGEKRSQLAWMSGCCRRTVEANIFSADLNYSKGIYSLASPIARGWFSSDGNCFCKKEMQTMKIEIK